MRMLMVTPYPPVRDGIAQYAVQEVKALRRAGHEVEVLSPGPSAAHHHLELRGARGVLALARRVHDYDRVIVQYHPDIFYPHPCAPTERALVTAALLIAFRRAPELEVRVHEIDFARGADSTVDRLLWRSADRIVVHTDAERDQFVAAFRVPPDRVLVEAHGAHFEHRTALSRAEARALLGLPEDERIFLCIGFIQPHKGFDRAVRAFRGLDAAGARLEIVGSVRVEQPEYLEYADELRRLVDDAPGARLHEEYTSDERFDAWIVASDVVVLPYRFIWSSGVLERAALYDRPVIASRTGGLGDQAPPGTTLVADDRGLEAAMSAALGKEAAVAPSLPWPDAPVERERIQAEVQERAAAVRGVPSRARPKGEPAVRGDGARARSAPLRRVPPLAPPMPVSARPGASTLKRLVRRLTAWEIDPLVHQVNKLRDAAIASTERTDPPVDGPSAP